MIRIRKRVLKSQDEVGGKKGMLEYPPTLVLPMLIRCCTKGMKEREGKVREGMKERKESNANAPNPIAKCQMPFASVAVDH